MSYPISSSSAFGSEIITAGLIGTGIQHSRSPCLHEQEGRELRLQYRYLKIELNDRAWAPARLGDILDETRERGFSGINITHPCKQTIIPFLDELSPDAIAVGAVNAVVLQGSRRTGHNTDWWGFYESFRRNLPVVKHEHVVLLGAGGAGAAVAYALIRAGVRWLTVRDVIHGRARALVANLNRQFGRDCGDASDDLRLVATADGLVNATMVGMSGYPGTPIPIRVLRPGLWVADVVYFPLHTALLQAARTQGCVTLGGGGMVVFQAARSLELFTGAVPDPARMLRHFESMDAQ